MANTYHQTPKIQIGEYVYVYFDKYRDHKYSAIRSKDMNNWDDISEEISFPKGLRHGVVFRFSEMIFDGLKMK